MMRERLQQPYQPFHWDFSILIQHDFNYPLVI